MPIPSKTPSISCPLHHKNDKVDHFARLRSSVSTLDCLWDAYTLKCPSFADHRLYLEARLSRHLALHHDDLIHHPGTIALATFLSAIATCDNHLPTGEPPLWFIEFDPILVVSFICCHPGSCLTPFQPQSLAALQNGGFAANYCNPQFTIAIASSEAPVQVSWASVPLISHGMFLFLLKQSSPYLLQHLFFSTFLFSQRSIDILTPCPFCNQ